MKYGSVCSGIEAASVAWHPLGWEPVWFSEIEKFPSKVLAHHYPHVPNLGDMTKLNENEIYSYTDIDLLVGGTPCQSFSIAGLRGGLGDDRGNLALIYCRILIEKQPRWFVWENVPGVFSSYSGGKASKKRARAFRHNIRKGKVHTETSDFASILNAFRKCGYSCAYRVLDSQYFGVPQRRRRVFVVGYLGDDWRPPAAVLFERESLRRDLTPRREKGQEVAALTSTGVGTCGADDNQAQGGHLIACGDFSQRPTKPGHTAHVVMATGQPNAEILRDQSPTLIAGHENPILFSIMPQNSGKDYKARKVDVTQPLMASPVGGNQGGDYVLQPIPFDTTQITSKANGSNPQPGDQCHPLSSSGHPPAIAFNPNASAFDSAPVSEDLFSSQPAVFMAGQGSGAGSIAYSEDSPPTLRSSQSGGNMVPSLHAGTRIRRLTPLECERLQGFPDNYTNIPGASDSARYAGIGNSMTVHVMRWIGERIKLVDNILNP